MRKRRAFCRKFAKSIKLAIVILTSFYSMAKPALAFKTKAAYGLPATLYVRLIL